ncbi:hypothetical protein ACQ4PT_015726 [Festuca glaucescens]
MAGAQPHLAGQGPGQPPQGTAHPPFMAPGMRSAVPLAQVAPRSFFQPAQMQPMQPRPPVRQPQAPPYRPPSYMAPQPAAPPGGQYGGQQLQQQPGYGPAMQQTIAYAPGVNLSRRGLLWFLHSSSRLCLRRSLYLRLCLSSRLWFRWRQRSRMLQRARKECGVGNAQWTPMRPKIVRPSALVLWTGLLETYFTSLPDSVVDEDLVPSQSPIVRVVISSDVVPADIVAKQVARRCTDRQDWKWEAMPNGENEFLKIWLHVEGVPHSVRHFLGLWAVGSLVGKIVDVDLATLRRKGIVRIQMAMLDSKVLQRLAQDSNVFVKSNVLVKFKGFDFRFRREPDDFEHDADFIPFIWVKKDDGDEGGSGNGLDDDAMDTSEARIGPSEVVTPQAQTGGSSSGGAGGVKTASIAVTPFNPNPQNPLAKEMVAKLRVLSPGLERRSPPTRPLVSAQELHMALSLATPQSSPLMQGTPSASGSLASDRPARGRVHTLGRLTHSASRRASASPPTRVPSSSAPGASGDEVTPSSPRRAVAMAAAEGQLRAERPSCVEQHTRVEMAGGAAVAAARPGACPVQPRRELDAGGLAAAARERGDAVVASAAALEGAQAAGDAAAMVAGGEGSTLTIPSTTASSLSSSAASGGGGASDGLGGGSSPPSPPYKANEVGIAAVPVSPRPGLVQPSTVSGGAAAATHVRQGGRWLRLDRGLPRRLGGVCVTAWDSMGLRRRTKTL